MSVPRIEDLEPRPSRARQGSRLWAEWCFVRVCFQHFRLRLALMLLVLFGGGLMFQALEPEKDHSLIKAMHMCFLLIFGEPPEDLPDPLGLQVLFFLIPIMGITVIIEGIIDFALIVRDRQRFEKNWCTMLASSMHDHVILVGLGRLGYRTFLTLRRLGEPVVLIERDPTNQFLDDVRRAGAPLMIGDARREALLLDANVAKARSIVLATDDDLANLECAMDARKVNPTIKVVLRMFDQNMADKVRDGFSIELAMSQSAISAPTFACCAIAPSTVNSAIVDGEMVTMQRWLVRRGDPLAGNTVGELLARRSISVVHHARAGSASAHFPSSELRFEAGDGLLLQGRIQDLEQLRRDGGLMVGSSDANDIAVPGAPMRSGPGGETPTEAASERAGGSGTATAPPPEDPTTTRPML